MSFHVVTVLWTVKIFLIYTLMAVGLPWLVMGRFLRGRSLSQKFVFSIVAGNFFYIMIVLLWGLLHITSRYVLIAATLLPPAAILFSRRQRIWERWLQPLVIHLKRLFRNENSLRYSRRLLFRWAGRRLGGLFRRTGLFLRHNFFELILFAGCSAFVLWFFSRTEHFGPIVPDLTVHMSWINAVDEGRLFSDGIYPFGMHALLYYFHVVFDIPTVRLLLVFGTVQTFYIFTMLLVFLKEICRFRYTPYLAYLGFAVGHYLVGGAWYGGNFERYYSTLPQEYGMLFILPCGIALLRFFRAASREHEEYLRMKREKLLYTRVGKKQKWKESTVQLWLLIISFGLTLSAHFYNTFIAALLILAAAAAHIRFVFRPDMLRRLVCAAILSVLIPVLPMAIAFAQGTPLQASLYWGLQVIEGEEEASGETEETEMTEETGEPAETGGSEEAAEPGTASESAGRDMSETGEEGSGEDLSREPEGAAEAKLSGTERFRAMLDSWKGTIEDVLEYHIFTSPAWMEVWAWCLLLLLVQLPVLWLLKEGEYARTSITVLLFTGLLVFLCVSGDLGLFTVMDMERAPIFCCYAVLAPVSLAPDGLLVILNRLLPARRVWQTASLLLAALLAAGTAAGGYIRPRTEPASSLERDGAALCVYDIMENYPEKKWTIVSCNEERNMVSPVAWHYEVIDFLDSMEDYQEGDEMYIPTQYVFFFIEKKSLDYGYGEFEGVDARVSEEWASGILPVKNQLTQYNGTNRIILNARMYYWAQAYMERFPNEMKIYYEDEDFVCYYIEQNEYFLNNFAIDYGYNSGR